MLERRIDHIGVVGQVERTPGGGIRIRATPTRVGVLEYETAAGDRRREYRSEEEVFAADSLASLTDSAVTIDHPSERVDRSNWDRHAVGYVAAPGKPASDRRLVETKLVIQTQRGVDKVKPGTELSAGYVCKLRKDAGVWTDPRDGRQYPYDAVQTEIRYDHIAMLEPGEGRAGPECCVRYDAAMSVITESAPPAGERKMKIVKVDGKEYTEGTPEHMAALTAYGDKLIGENAILKRDAAKLATETARADNAEKHAKVIEKQRVIDRAVALMGARFDKAAAQADAVDSTEIMKQVIRHLNPDVDLEGANNDMIVGMFRVLLPNAVKAPETAEGKEGEEGKDKPEGGAKTPEGAPLMPPAGTGGAKDSRSLIRDDSGSLTIRNDAYEERAIANAMARRKLLFEGPSAK